MSADGMWRLQFAADSGIPAQVAKDVQALNKLEEKAKKAGKAVDQAVKKPGKGKASTSGSADAPGSTDAAGMGIPPKLVREVEAIKAAEGKLTRMAGAGSALNRILGKILPGGGLGNTLGDAAGGTIGGTAAAGLGFMAIGMTRKAIEQARAMDENADAMASAIERINRFSDPTVTSLSSLGAQIEIFLGILSKLSASNIANQFNLLRVGGGALASAGTGMLASISRFLGFNRFADFEDQLSELFNDQAARGILGMTGDTSDQDVGRAEKRLAAAKSKTRQTSSRGTDPSSGFIPPTDELARMGLFVGGSSESLGLLREQVRRLDAIERAVYQIPAGMADSL